MSRSTTREPTTWREGRRLRAWQLFRQGWRQRPIAAALGVSEGAKEDKAGWSAFLKHLKERGLKGAQLFVSDACSGLIESIAEFFPESRWRRLKERIWRQRLISFRPTSCPRKSAKNSSSSIFRRFA